MTRQKTKVFREGERKRSLGNGIKSVLSHASNRFLNHSQNHFGVGWRGKREGRGMGRKGENGENEEGMEAERNKGGAGGRCGKSGKKENEGDMEAEMSKNGRKMK